MIVFTHAEPLRKLLDDYRRRRVRARPWARPKEK
jgi:hypothetical protein